MAQALGDLELAASTADILAVIQHTLAWQQLGPDQRQILIRVVEAAYAAFEAQPHEQRERWARSGTSLPTARTLNAVAEGLLARFNADPTLDLDDLQAVVAFVFDEETLITLLGLKENTRRGFKPYRTAPRDKTLNVDFRVLLLDWVAGVEIQELANRHLAAIPDAGYRSEALAEFNTSVFGHHLPWTGGIILQWVNTRMEGSGGVRRIPEHLPLAIHYGVGTRTALDLMRGGIRSRRLANAVATHADGRTLAGESPLRDWLADQTITHWREHFAASPTEVADLLLFVRAPGAQVVSSVLSGSTHELTINTHGHPIGTGGPAKLDIQPDSADPVPIQVVTSTGVIGTIRPADHDEVSQLLNLGVRLNIEVSPSATGAVATISLAP